MKNTIKKGAVYWYCFRCVTFACKDKFLDVPATGQLAGAQLTSKAGLEGLLLSLLCPVKWSWIFPSTSSYNWVRGSVSGGEANKGSNSGDGNSLNSIPALRIQSCQW